MKYIQMMKKLLLHRNQEILKIFSWNFLLKSYEKRWKQSVYIGDVWYFASEKGKIIDIPNPDENSKRFVPKQIAKYKDLEHQTNGRLPYSLPGIFWCRSTFLELTSSGKLNKFRLNELRSNIIKLKFNNIDLKRLVKRSDSFMPPTNNLNLDIESNKPLTKARVRSSFSIKVKGIC